MVTRANSQILLLLYELTIQTAHRTTNEELNKKYVCVCLSECSFEEQLKRANCLMNAWNEQYSYTSFYSRCRFSLSLSGVARHGSQPNRHIVYTFWRWWHSNMQRRRAFVPKSSGRTWQPLFYSHYVFFFNRGPMTLTHLRFITRQMDSVNFINNFFFEFLKPVVWWWKKMIRTFIFYLNR